MADTTAIQRPPRTSLALWLLLASLAVGAGVRVWRLGDGSLTPDEATVAAAGRLPLAQAISYDQNHPPIHYGLMHFWVQWALTEGQVRLSSAVCGIATIGVAYLLGCQVLTPLFGALLAAAVALSPYHAHLSRETRPYPLLILLIACHMCCLVAALRHGRGRAFAGMALFAVASLYTHYLGGIALVAGLLCCVWNWRSLSKEAKWGSGLTHLFLCLLCLYGLLSAAHASTGSAQFRWEFSPSQAIAAPLAALWGLSLDLHRISPPQPLGDLLLVGGLGAGLLALAGTLGNHLPTLPRRMLWSYLLVSVVACELLSAWTTFAEPKYWSPVVMPFYVAAAAGVVTLWRFNRGAALAAVLVGGLSFAAVLPKVLGAAGSNPDWRAAVEFVEGRVREGDLVVVPPWHGPLAAFYSSRPLDQTEADDPPINSPADIDGRYARLWGIFRDGDNDLNSTIRLALEPFASRQRGEWQFQRLRVRLYVLRNSDAASPSGP